MAVVGYARVSSLGQSLDVQLDKLKEAGVEKVFSEKESGANGDREELATMLDWVRSGDIVVVTKIDRLARSMSHFWKTVDTLQEKGCELKVLDVEGMDTTTPIGRLIMGVLSAVAEFERNIAKERQYDGIQKAKANNRYQGRKPLSDDIRAKAREMVASGVKKAEAARKLGIGRTSLYRLLAEDK